MSGEGKTTLLMRLAWEAAQAGYPVLWRHYGTVETPYEHPFASPRRILICVDELPYADELPRLLSDLSESGVPFVLLGTARTHEWQNSPVRSEAARLVAWQEFPLERLSETEARGVLERLETHNALGALAGYPPDQRLAFFLDRLQADGQLLPALLTARAGRGFQAILEDVFDRLQRRWGEERALFLLRGYAGIALVHRFGFWMSRPLLARFLDVNEADLTPRLLTPLRGELTEVTEADAYRLYTRHPWIAERAMTLLAGNRLSEEGYLYEHLFRALGTFLAATPGAEERKLLTKIPLAFKYRGEPEVARRLFRQATQADPKSAPTWQAWALLEKEQKNIEKAWELFQRATQADPKHAPAWQAWALLEKEQGNIEKARELFQRATQADPKHAPAWQAWALLEAQNRRPVEARRILEEGLSHITEPRGRALLHSTLGGLLARQRKYMEAEEQFRQALELDPHNPLTHYHYAVDCLLPQHRMDEACHHLREAQRLGVRKARDRRRIEQALKDNC